MKGDLSFSIAVDLSRLMPPDVALNREAFPYLAHAVETVVAAAEARWKDFANGAPLPNGRIIQNRTGEYVRSIMTRSLGDFGGEVYSELPYARVIEEGSEARDMKRMLDSSFKVRITKEGKRYLIIPFRHNHPESVLGNNMPVEVYRWWQKEGRESSSVAGSFLRKSGTGALHARDGVSHLTGQPVRKGAAVMVPGWRYNWGSRLHKSDLEEMGFHRDDKVAKRLAGMVHFRTPGASAGAAHGKYLTFRVMMEGSKGWIAPARPGMFPAKATADEIRPVAEEIFAGAVEQDVKRLLNVAG